MKAITFIELLIVILIIATLAVLSVPQFRKTFNSFEFSGFVKDIYYLSHYLRESAISKGKVYCLNIDTQKSAPQFYATCQPDSEAGAQWVRLEGRFAKIYRVPQGATILSIEPADKKNIYFYPDGSIDSVTIILAYAKTETSLIIRGASGAIQIK